jgi:hypothetical protein
MTLSMASRIVTIGLALLACSSNPEQPQEPAQNECRVHKLARVVAVSCAGETCMVCDDIRCRTWLFADCR